MPSPCCAIVWVGAPSAVTWIIGSSIRSSSGPTWDGSSADQAAFTVDPVSYRTVAANSDNSVQSDYDGDGGDTIRFGDSVFGANPDIGMQFTSRYCYGSGPAGNVAADAASRLDPITQATGLFNAVTNPLAATDGADAQTLQSIQRLAPQALLASQLRAVLAADYTTAARSLPWVKRAGTVFRWTGSWLTTFTTPEPGATEQIAIGDRTMLIDLPNRYRMAGTEVHVPDPDYESIDLIVELCATANAFAAQVKQLVTAALSPTGPGAPTAFFAVSQFSFRQVPRQYECVAIPQSAPLFISIDSAQAGYAQLLPTADLQRPPSQSMTPPNTILAGAEDGSEMGAYARDKNPIRAQALLLKLQEYMPANLVPVIVSVT